MLRLGTRISSMCAAVAGALVGAVALAGPARADGFQDCLDKAATHGGEPPTCTKINGHWVATWPDDSGGNAGAIALVVVLGAFAAVGIVIWKVTTAQRLARDAGLDPGLATQMTLLSDDGLDATYLAASLRQPPPTPRPDVPTPAPRPVAERLSELATLREQGLITQAEHDARRQAIIDQV